MRKSLEQRHADKQRGRHWGKLYGFLLKIKEEPGTKKELKEIWEGQYGNGPIK